MVQSLLTHIAECEPKYYRDPRIRELGEQLLRLRRPDSHRPLHVVRSTESQTTQTPSASDDTTNRERSTSDQIVHWVDPPVRYISPSTSTTTANDRLSRTDDSMDALTDQMATLIATIIQQYLLLVDEKLYRTPSGNCYQTKVQCKGLSDATKLDVIPDTTGLRPCRLCCSSTSSVSTRRIR